jgi:septum site-determining protein MinD
MKMVEQGEMLGVEDVQEILGTGVQLLGVVPDDESIITSTNSGEPASMSETSRAGQAYRNIARRLLGEEVPFMQLAEVKQGGIFAKIKKMFGG